MSHVFCLTVGLCTVETGVIDLLMYVCITADIWRLVVKPDTSKRLPVLTVVDSLQWYNWSLTWAQLFLLGWGPAGFWWSPASGRVGLCARNGSWTESKGSVIRLNCNQISETSTCYWNAVWKVEMNKFITLHVSQSICTSWITVIRQPWTCHDTINA